MLQQVPRTSILSNRTGSTPHCHGPSPLYRRWAANHYDYGEEEIAGSKRLCSLPASATPSTPERNSATHVVTALSTHVAVRALYGYTVIALWLYGCMVM